MAPLADHDGVVAPRAPARLGSLIGAVAAVVCSFVLAFWVGSGGRYPAAPTLRRSPESAAMSVSGPPSPAQVRRAYNQVRDVYSEYGLRGVIAVADGCRNAVAATPAQLDFCVAFAVDAAALAAASNDPAAIAWSAGAERQQLSLIRGVVGSQQDPAARLMQIRDLTRAMVHADRAAKEAAHRRLALASDERTRRRSGSCRGHAAATGAACGKARPVSQDVRMKTAYRRALAHSADPAGMERVQAQWRDAFKAAKADPKLVSDLYRIRMRQLEDTAGRRHARNGSELETAEARTSVPPY